MEEVVRKKQIKDNIWLTLSSIMPILAMVGGCYVYGIPMDAWISKGIYVLMCSFLLFYSATQERLYDHYMLHKEFKAGLFFVLFICSLGLAIFCPSIPIPVWPYLVIYVTLYLFSNMVTGFVGGTSCLIISLLLSNNGDLYILLMYLLCGMAAILFFRGLDLEFKIGYPIFLSELFMLLCIVFFSGYMTTFDASILLFAAVNVVLSFIMLLLVLKLYSGVIAHKEREKYLELIDQDSDLLKLLKEKSEEEYLKAIHVSHFCEIICKALDLVPTKTKVAAYYHSIALTKQSTISWEATEEICKQYNFPKEVQHLLKELIDNDTQIVDLEAAIVFLSRYVISTIGLLQKENHVKSEDYETIIDSIMKRVRDSKKIDHSNVTLAQFETMKNIFIEEKIYYDFLRR